MLRLPATLLKGSIMNKTAIITGASRGIGRELAGLLYKKSYSLGLVARKFDKKHFAPLRSTSKQKTAIYNYDLSTLKLTYLVILVIILIKIFLSSPMFKIFNIKKIFSYEELFYLVLINNYLEKI